MRISKLTILEMFAQPNDLYFSLTRPEGKAQHALLISRGPGHDYKLLITSDSGPVEREEAIAGVGEILKAVLEVGTASIQDPSDIFAEINNPDRLPVADLEVLKQDRVDRILVALKTQDRVESWQV